MLKSSPKLIYPYHIEEDSSSYSLHAQSLLISSPKLIYPYHISEDSSSYSLHAENPHGADSLVLHLAIRG